MTEADLFMALNKSSSPMRDAAKDLSNVIKKHSGKTRFAVNGLCNTLNNLQTSKIENIGDVLFDLNENLQLATLKLNRYYLDHPIEKSEEEIKVFLDELSRSGDALTKEITLFAKNASELSRKLN